MTSKNAVYSSRKKDVVQIFSSLRPGLLPDNYMEQLSTMGYAIVDIKRLPSRLRVAIRDETNPSEHFLVLLWQIPKWQNEQVTDISVYPVQNSSTSNRASKIR